MAENWLTNWRLPHNILDCDSCDATFLHPQAQTGISCPFCGHEQFSELASTDDSVLSHEPEYILPMTQDSALLSAQLQKFQKSVPLAPFDCTVTNLIERATLFYWPMWLVDSDVTARWQAETGFDYDAVTYGEKFNEGQWRSIKKKEQRIRWEPRLGELKRHYADQMAPALDEHEDVIRLLGKYDWQKKRPFTPSSVEENLIRMPVRSTQDAWSDAESQIHQSSAEECRVATGAQHIRHFKWAPQFHNQHWTQLLLPIISTFYHDDDGQKQMVYLHGQSGRVIGQRKASMKRALQYAIRIGVGAGVLLGLTAVLWLLQTLSQTAISSNLIDFLMFLIFCATVSVFIPPINVTLRNSRRASDENQQITNSLYQSSKEYWREEE